MWSISTEKKGKLKHESAKGVKNMRILKENKSN
jgi:hypothetical protein